MPKDLDNRSKNSSVENFDVEKDKPEADARSNNKNSTKENKNPSNNFMTQLLSSEELQPDDILPPKSSFSN